MATLTTTIPQSNASDASWRAWGQAIHNALVALGTLTQTSDTGQANWTTATRAGGAYEMWKSADALTPFYLRITFSSTSVCAIQFSYGEGTNGAGTLTGNVCTHSVVGFTNTATAQTYLFSSTSSRLTIWFEADALHGAGTNGAIFDIERARDNVGAEIATGVESLMFWSASSGNSQSGWITLGSGFPGVNLNNISLALNCIFADVPTLSSTGQMTVFALNVSGANYCVQNPLLGVLLYWADDLTLSAPIRPITIYGGAHTYKNPGAVPNVPNINAKALALMLYE